MKGWKEEFVRLLYPPRCAVCAEVLQWEERKGFLCENCKEVPYFPHGICPRCGGSNNHAGFCAKCVYESIFTFGCAAFDYETVRQAVRLFKYQGDLEIGRGLSQLMASYLLQYHKDLPEKIDVIFPVPLHPKREKMRGFNQAYILCEELAEAIKVPLQNYGVERRKETIAQNELSPEERKWNLKDAFCATEDFTGKRILLVDDILTTGITCTECARELYRAGAAEVSVVTLSAAGKLGI